MSVFRDVFGSWCVYGHFIGNECIYVGAGSLKRAFDPSRTDRWKSVVGDQAVDVVIFRQFSDRLDALRYETDLIESLRPRCNKFKNPSCSDKRPDLHKPVRHVPSGRTFSTLTEACRVMGMGAVTINSIADRVVEPIGRFNFEWV